MKHGKLTEFAFLLLSKRAASNCSRLCEGGELFFLITKRKYLTESLAASIMKQIFSAIKYCHSRNICHRDLKPENFLLKNAEDESNIKVIDFGLSKKLSENELMNSPNGTISAWVLIKSALLYCAGSPARKVRKQL